MANDINLLRMEQVASLLDIPISTLRYWRQCTPPYGPPSTRLGRRVVYREADVRAWLDEQFAATSAS